MFEIGASEILLIAIVALIAIGPKDLPEILFRLGRLVRRMRMMLGGLRDQYSEIMHEAELNHYRKEFGAKLMDERDIDEALNYQRAQDAKTDEKQADEKQEDDTV